MSSTIRCSPSMRAARKSVRPPGKWKLALAGTSSVARLSSQRPADLDAAEQIGLGARHLEQARRRELAPCRRRSRGSGWKRCVVPRRFCTLPTFDHLAGRLAARIGLPVEHLVARDFGDQLVAKRVDDRDADAVQAARGLVGLAVELAARVQRGHDDLERRRLGNFGWGSTGMPRPLSVTVR